jgi:peptidyl-prolyl cis-trans isomerase SurA
MVRLQHSRFLLGSLAVGLAGALFVPPGAAAQETQEAQESEPEPAAAVLLARLDETAGTVVNMILVRVSGDPILLSEVRERMDTQMEALRSAFPEEEIQAQLPELRFKALLAMIDEMMMQQRAERMGIVIGANDVDRWVQQVRENNGFASDAELEAELVSIGMSMEALREQARKQLAQNRLVFEEVQRSVFVSETEIVEYYGEHEDDFRTSEEVRLEQLVFIGAPADLAEQAAAAARELQAGADLETVGGKYVDATPMADTGTFIAVDDLTEGLVEAVPNLPTGTYSDPVATNFGLSIVKVLERTDQQTATLDDVR